MVVCLVYAISFQTTGRRHQLISFDGLVIHTLWHIFSVISSVVFAFAYFYKINIAVCGGPWEEWRNSFNEHTQKMWKVNVDEEKNCLAHFLPSRFPCSTVVVCHSFERKCSINLTCGNNRFDINIRLSLRIAHKHTHSHGILYVSVALIDINLRMRENTCTIEIQWK